MGERAVGIVETLQSRDDECVPWGRFGRRRNVNALSFRMAQRFHDDADVAAVAQLLADRARSAMLFALSDGRALSAGELARLAGVSPATASAHLSMLVSAALLTVVPQGRHRYYRLVEPRVIEAMESIAALAPRPAESAARAGRAMGVRAARTCYDHLAGALGVRLTDALVEQRRLVLSARSYRVTENGSAWFDEIGIEIPVVRERADRTRRDFARACLDWSERRWHLAGALGAALCARCLDAGWIERRPASRAVRVTNSGRRAIRRHFGIAVD